MYFNKRSDIEATKRDEKKNERTFKLISTSIVCFYLYDNWHKSVFCTILYTKQQRGRIPTFVFDCRDIRVYISALLGN